jgi:hypothetical protein
MKVMHKGCGTEPVYSLAENYGTVFKFLRVFPELIGITLKA